MMGLPVTPREQAAFNAGVEAMRQMAMAVAVTIEVVAAPGDHRAGSVLTPYQPEVGIGDTYTLARAQVTRIGARIEVMLVSDDGSSITFAASPEQADKLAEDLEEVLDESPATRPGRRPMQ